MKPTPCTGGVGFFVGKNIMNLFCSAHKSSNPASRKGWDKIWGEQGEETEDPARKQKDGHGINDYTAQASYPQGEQD